MTRSELAELFDTDLNNILDCFNKAEKIYPDIYDKIHLRSKDKIADFTVEECIKGMSAKKYGLS